jgi:hypothetical protein
MSLLQVDDLKFALHLAREESPLQGQNMAGSTSSVGPLRKWRWEDRNAIVRKDGGVVLEDLKKSRGLRHLVVPRPFVVAHYGNLQRPVPVQLLVKVPMQAVQQARALLVQTTSTEEGACGLSPSAGRGGGLGGEGTELQTSAACHMSLIGGTTDLLGAKVAAAAAGGGGCVASSTVAAPLGDSTGTVGASAPVCKGGTAAVVETGLRAAAEAGPSGSNASAENCVVATFTGQLCKANSKPGQTVFFIIRGTDKLMHPFVHWKLFKWEHVVAQVSLAN